MCSQNNSLILQYIISNSSNNSFLSKYYNLSLADIIINFSENKYSTKSKQTLGTKYYTLFSSLFLLLLLFYRYFF